MPTSADPSKAEVVLVDTSVAVPLLDAGDADHERLHEALRGSRLGLAGHAAFETFSVLTRRPTPSRVSARAAAMLIERAFPETRALQISDTDVLLAEFALLGIAGGSVYDALVAVTAREHGLPLMTRDVRAERVYRLLGVDYRIL